MSLVSSRILRFRPSEPVFRDALAHKDTTISARMPNLKAAAEPWAREDGCAVLGASCMQGRSMASVLRWLLFFREPTWSDQSASIFALTIFRHGGHNGSPSVSDKNFSKQLYTLQECGLSVGVPSEIANLLVVGIFGGMPSRFCCWVLSL